MSEDNFHINSDLIRRIAEGEESAFESFVKFYGPQLQRIIFKIIHNEAPVLDIIQDIFLNIWITRQKLPELESVDTWVFKIAYYRSYTWLRQQAVRQRAREKIGSRFLADQTNPVEEAYMFSETKRIIQAAIHQLPSKTKRIYLMSREENYTISEIAEQLNLSPQTVKNTLSNALRSIRKYLENKGIILPVTLLALYLL